MADHTTDVLVGGYPGIDAALTDFDALAKLVEDKKVEMEAAILITHAEDGSVNVAQTADHRGRKGVEWGGAVGVLVGLAAPPLLAATAAGAVAGGLLGKFVDHRVETQMHDKIGEQSAARNGRDPRDVRRVAAPRRRAGAAGSACEVGRPVRQGRAEGAQGRPRGGDGQVRPRPHRAADPGPELRRHDGPHDRPVRARLDDHPGAEGSGGGAERPADPDRRRRVRAARHVRWAGRDAEPDAGRADGPALQPLPRRRALLADAGRRR